MKTSIKVEGLKELEAALAELPKSTGKNVMRRVARKALEPVIAAAKPYAPWGKGKLRKSLAVSTKLSKRQASLARGQDRAEGKASITVYAGATALPHAHLMEFGTKNRVQKSTGRSTGSVKPRPFMRPAWDAKKDEVLKIFRTDMWKEIEAAAQRLAKKQAKLLAKSKGD